MINYCVGGVKVCSLSKLQLAQTCLDDFKKKHKEILPKLVFSMNGEGISNYNRSKAFRSLVDQADLVHPDGMSVVWAGRLFSSGEFPERVATTDAFHDVARACEKNGLSFYFLGGKDDVNLATVNNVKKMYPKLRIAGRQHGYFDAADDVKICQNIVISGADVVWVALGRPKQEDWCVRNRSNLLGVSWLKTCGGLFDFLSDSKPRATNFMQSIGLEWLYRLSHEPKRLFWRYLVTNFHSIYCYIVKTKRKSYVD